MNLNVEQRLLILGILPVRSNLSVLRIVDDLRHELGFNEEELKQAGIEQVNGSGIKWDQERDFEKDVSIGEKATDVIKAALKEASRNNDLTARHLPVCEMFGVE